MEQQEQNPLAAMGPKFPTLDELTEDYRRLQRQKSRKTGGVEGRVLMNLAFVDDNHYCDFRDGQLINETRDDNKLYLTFNLIKGRLNKIIGRIAGLNPPFKATPTKNDPQSMADAEVIDKLIVALDGKLDQPSKFWETVWWMAVAGVAFEYTPWVPDSTIEMSPKMTETGELVFRNTLDGTEIPESQMMQLIAGGRVPKELFEPVEELMPVGEVGSEVLGPLNVFIDQSVKSIDDLAPDQRVYVAKIRTIGWVKKNFGIDVEAEKDLSIVTSRIASTGDTGGGRFLKDIIPLIQGSTSDTDPKMVVVVEAFGPTSDEFPKGTYQCFVPGKKILHEAENPYGEIPLTDFHWSPVTTTFWTQDYVSGLISSQRFINKRLSQLGEQSNASVYSQLLLGPGIKAADWPADYPGVVENGLTPEGNPNAVRMPGPDLPSWFMQSIELTLGLFNDAAGGADLFQENKFPGQLRGPMAVPMLQEILDTQWGPLYNHLGERLARVKQQRLNRVRDFYPPVRTLHYTSRDQKDEVLTFHSDPMMKGDKQYVVRVERGALLPELRALTEARILERLNGPLAILYMDERTGKLDKSKIAADLKFGDTGREDREAQYRKLAVEIIDMLWKGQQVPPPLPFYNHTVMLDELEASMATTEFLRTSPEIQALFLQRWEQHRFFLQQEAMAQQQMMLNGQIQTAVAQATQQAAAQAAAHTVESSRMQLEAQKGVDTGSLVRSANEQAEGENKPKPKPKSRKVTYEERE